jgi:hypothetical protein
MGTGKPVEFAIINRIILRIFGVTRATQPQVHPFKRVCGYCHWFTLEVLTTLVCVKHLPTVV